MVFKAVLTLTVLLVLGSSMLVGGRFLGLIDGPSEATATVCDALTSAQRRALVGTKTPYAEERPSTGGDERFCRWTVAEGDDSSLVEVTTMSAGQWVVALRGDLAGRRNAADAARRRVMERALALGSAADDRAACALASQMFELDGAERGARQRVSFRPGDRKTSPRMVAEECLAGTYTRIVASAPGLESSPALESQALTALGQVQQQLS